MMKKKKGNGFFVKMLGWLLLLAVGAGIGYSINNVYSSGAGDAAQIERLESEIAALESDKAALLSQYTAKLEQHAAEIAALAEQLQSQIDAANAVKEELAAQLAELQDQYDDLAAELHILTQSVSFAQDSWTLISYISDRGLAPVFYNIGDEKAITLSTNAEITVRILDFNHDVLADGSGKAPISLGLKGIMPASAPMNSDDSGPGGWDASEMRNETLPAIFATLPGELRALIKTVNKPTADGKPLSISTIINCQDKLWLFSLAELFTPTELAAHADVLDGEGFTYEYWKTHDALANSGFWWTRTAVAGYNEFYSLNASVYGSASSISFDVCFGFCI